MGSRAVALALVVLAVLSTGCVDAGDGGPDPEHEPAGAPATRTGCTGLLGAFNTPQGQVRSDLPDGVQPGNAPGFLGLPPVADNVTFAVLALRCDVVVIGDQRFNDTTIVDVLVKVRHPADAPPPGGAHQFYSHATLTDNVRLDRTLRALGVDVRSGRITLSTASTQEGSTWGGQMRISGRAGDVVLGVSGTSAHGASVPLRVFASGPDGQFFVNGTLEASDGNGTVGDASLQLTSSSLLGELTRARALEGRGAVIGHGGLADARIHPRTVVETFGDAPAQ